MVHFSIIHQVVDQIPIRIVESRLAILHLLALHAVGVVVAGLVEVIARKNPKSQKKSSVTTKLHQQRKRSRQLPVEVYQSVVQRNEVANESKRRARRKCRRMSLSKKTQFRITAR